MRRLVLSAVALALLGGTAFAAAPMARQAPAGGDLPWVRFATVADIQDATAKLAVGVAKRPPVLLQTNYYVYPFGEQTRPTLMLTTDDNGYPHPVTLYLYWQNRKTGERRYIANGTILDRGEVQDIFGTAGTPVWAPTLNEFQFFGPQGAWGQGPLNPTGLYMFGFEMRDVTGAEVISRGYALYSHVDAIVTVAVDVTSDTLWQNRFAYLLAKGGEDFPIHVGGKGQQGLGAISPTVLTIEPGTVIFGDKDALGTLSVARGSKLIANGTPLMPIIFTSAFEVGERSSGDWGGLVLNGFAPVGSDTGEREGEGETGFFGGTDRHDSSGVLSYVRVEFAGVLFTTEDELNGIALQGVGDGTVIRNVQVNRNADDGIEFFGGTASAENVLITGAEDDSVDWTFGWNGYMSDVVVWQGNVKADQGIEADNDKGVPDRQPRSQPKIFNATFVGGFPPGGSGDIAALLRRGTGGLIRDAIFVNFEDCGPAMHDQETYNQAANGGLVIANSIMYGNGSGKCSATGIYFDQAALDESLEDPENANLFVDPMLADPYNPIVPDLHPLPDGPAADAANAAPADYIGGLGPGDDWIYEPWTTFAQN